MRISLYLVLTGFLWQAKSNQMTWKWTGVYMYVSVSFSIYVIQGFGNSEPIAEHFDLFSTLLLSHFPFILYTAQFQFAGRSLDLSDNVLYDWLFPYLWLYLFDVSMSLSMYYLFFHSLIQATLGCLAVQEFGLSQDSQKIFRSASRLSRC